MTLRDVVFTFVYSSITSAGIATVIGFILRKHQSNLFRILLLLVFVSVSSDITSITLVKTGVLSASWPVSNFYHFIQFWIISLIYFYLIPNKKFRIVVYAVLALYTITFGYLLTDIEKFKELLSLPRTMTSIVFISYSIIYYYNILNAKELETLKNNTKFYLNSTIFLYFSSVFTIYLISEYIRSGPYQDFHPYLWIVHNAFGVLKNSMFIYIFYLNSQKIDGR